MHPPDSELIYDWNRAGGMAYPARGTVEFDDETLRDGLQSPSVTTPLDRAEARILHLMDALGIDSADIGLPGAGPHVVATSTRLAAEIGDAQAEDRAPTAPPARSWPTSSPIVEISQKVGIPIEVVLLHRLLADPPVRRGLGPRPHAPADRGRRVAGRARGAAGHVRHRGHDARPPGRHPPAVHRRRSSAARGALRLRHGRPRHARRRAQPRHASSRALVDRDQARRSRSTGTATTTAGSASSTRSARSRPAPTACTPARSASASASATRRWTSSS